MLKICIVRPNLEASFHRTFHADAMHMLCDAHVAATSVQRVPLNTLDILNNSSEGERVHFQFELNAFR